MKIHTIVVGPFQVNCYLWWNEESGDGFIIDPGDEAKGIISEIARLDVKPKAILLTHGHGDHIAGVTEIKEHFSIPLVIGKGEEPMLADPTLNLSSSYGQPVTASNPEHLLQDEQVFSVGNLSLKALSTPGHTPAGVCYFEEESGILFSGDTLFFGSIGRTDFPGSSHEQLLSSIQTKILTLPDSVVCYPGHGPQTTVGSERANNPFLQGGLYA